MKVSDLINIEFSYNGNLGVLQQRTIDNKFFCGRLLQSGIISREEWKEAVNAVGEYFAKEIRWAAEHPAHCIDTIGC